MELNILTKEKIMNVPNPGIEPEAHAALALQEGSLLLSHQGSPIRLLKY